jgi:DNA-binding NarL/FixJ family response regulator
MSAWDTGRFTAELVERAQTARDLAGMREELLDSLQALIPCETIFWGHAPGGPTDGADHYRAADAVTRAALERFVAARARYDLPALVRAVHADGGVGIDVEFISATDRDRRPLYTDVLRPAGIDCYIVCIPRFRGRPSSLICFGRHGPRAHFVPGEKDLLRSIICGLGTVEAALRADSLGADDDGPTQALLAPREAQVARLIASGLQDKDVAALLGASPETVHKQRLRTDEKASHRSVEALTRREREVASLVRRGLQNKEIAAELGTSVETVRKQTISIYAKLGVSGRVELAVRLMSSVHG